MRRLTMFDIDGCLCPELSRLAAATVDGVPDWHQFHGAGMKENATQLAIKKVREAYERGDDVIFVTGRSVDFYHATMEWLCDQLSTMKSLIEFTPHARTQALFMRSIGSKEKSPELKVRILTEFLQHAKKLGVEYDRVSVYDNRIDVLVAVRSHLIIDVEAWLMNADSLVCEPLYVADQADPVVPTEPPKFTAAEVLAQMSDTFRKRNAVYKDNAVMVGNVMANLFPEGVAIRTPADFEKFHLFELLVVKLTRFVLSDLQHIDSIHDAAVYAAMIEAILRREK